MSLHFFVNSGNLFHFEGPKEESEFDQQLFCEMGALIQGNRFLGFYCFQQPIKTLYSSNLDLCHWQIWKWSKEYIG